MSLLLVLSLLSFVTAQSSGLAATNTCLRRSVAIYTDGSATFVVTDFGSTNILAQPTICPNVSTSTAISISISTIYGANYTVVQTTALPASTLTVCEPALTTATLPQQSLTPDVYVSDYGFEGGSELPFNSSSSAGVTAEVTTGGPILPFSGDNYLLITFDGPSSTTALRNVRRQTSQPLSYNVTQMFAATAGTTYTISAYAADVQMGSTEPDCSLTICGEGACGPPSALTTSYSSFSYQWASPEDNPAAVATLVVQCALSAYVALDNVTIVANGNGSTRSSIVQATTTVFVTRTQTVQTTIPILTTIEASAPLLTQTTIATIFNTKLVEFTPAPATTTILSTKYITERANVTVPGPLITETSLSIVTLTATSLSSYPISQNASAPSTTTVFSTQYITATTVATLPPSLITETAITTAYVTATSLSAFPVTQNASILDPSTTTVMSTLYITRTFNETLPASLVTETATTTAFLTATSVSGFPVYQNASTFTYLTTEYVSVTADPLTFTSYITVTPLPIQTYIPPAVTETLPALTNTETLEPVTNTLRLTATETTQLPVVTETLPALTNTETLLPITNTLILTATATQTTQLPAVTITLSGVTSSSSTELSTSTSFYSTATFSVASGVPSVALASPTAVTGDINGAPRSIDDEAFPVTVPFNLTLFGQASTQVYVTSNGVVGWNNGDYTYQNEAWPNTLVGHVSDTAAYALWDDLFINVGTQQGIYYQTDGVAPNRVMTFEFYLSHCCSGLEYYHFLISFAEASPNIVTYQYLNVSDYGSSATVGVASVPAGNQQVVFSYDQPVINPGMILRFNTSGTTPGYTILNPGVPRSAAAVASSSVANRAWEKVAGMKTRLNQWLEPGAAEMAQSVRQRAVA